MIGTIGHLIDVPTKYKAVNIMNERTIALLTSDGVRPQDTLTEIPDLKKIKTDIRFVKILSELKNIDSDNDAIKYLYCESVAFSDLGNAAFGILDQLVGKINAVLDENGGKNSDINKSMAILHNLLLNNNFSYAEYDAKYSKTFSENLANKKLNCNSYSYIILAVAQQRAKTDRKWLGVNLASIPGHTFIKCGNGLNYDRGQSPTDDQLKQVFDFPNEYAFKILDKSALISDVYSNIAAVMLLDSDDERSLECAKIALIYDKYNARAHYNMGIIYETKKMFAEALAEYSASVETDRFYFAARFKKGEMLLDIQKFREAAECFEFIAKYQKQHHLALYNLGNAYFYLKQYAEAINSYTSAINCYDKDADYFFNRGMAKVEENILFSAREDFVRAKKLGLERADEYIRRLDAYFGK